MTTSDSRPYPRAIPYLAVAAAIFFALPIPVSARAFIALPLVLYFPGIALVAAAFPGVPRTPELQVLAVAMSLACTVLIGILLGLAGHLNAHGWAAGLCTVTIGCCILSLRKVRRPKAAFPWLEVRERGRSSVASVADTGERGTIPWVDLALGVTALCIATGAYTLARHGAITQVVAPYTDFWMIPENADRPTLATVGIKNEEGRQAVYHVDILQRGHFVGRWPAVVLKPGATFTFEIAFNRRPPPPSPPAQRADEPLRQGLDLSQALAEKPSAPTERSSPTRSDEIYRQAVDPSANRVEARLYKDGVFDVVYRKVWVALPLSASASRGTETPADSDTPLDGRPMAVVQPPPDLRVQPKVTLIPEVRALPDLRLPPKTER